jgi:hypothetical protein
MSMTDQQQQPEPTPRDLPLREVSQGTPTQLRTAGPERPRLAISGKRLGLGGR